MSSIWRSRWAAVGAAIAVALGAGGLGIAQATTSTGERPIYQPINPCRLADTRPAPDTVGGRTSPIGPEESYTLSGWGDVGNCSLPNGTAGLALNVTAFGPTDPTYLTLYPTGAMLPTTSNLNPTPGQPPTPNAVNVDLSPGGEFDVFNKYGSVHAIIDVVGYYDDHDHDDRYWTKEQSGQTMWARVDSDASLIDGTAGVTSEKYTSNPTGRYVVHFPRDITGCALVLQNNEANTDVANGTAFEASSPEPDDVFVYLENESNVAEDRPFSLLVICNALTS
jgi:hypothetical protein